MHPWAAPYLMVRLGSPIELDEDDPNPFAPEPERPPGAPPLFPAWRFDPSDPFIDVTSALRSNLAWRELFVDARRRTKRRPEPEGSEVQKAIASWDELDSWDPAAPPAPFRAVVAAGPAVIKPLLDCLENDERWTRIRAETGCPHTLILRLRDLAIHALNRVLQSPAVEIPSP